MSNKKIYTRGEFEQMRVESAAKMADDTELKKDALDVLVRADRDYHWLHQTTWMGEPILNLPQDMFALQEIIFQTRPRFIIEVGVAWGGTLLFYSTLMEAIGGEAIIGVDVYIPDTLRQRLASHGRLFERLKLITGSSVDANTVDQVKAIVGNCRQVLVVLDSNHTHAHVLDELRLYAPLVGLGCYLVCGDTIIEDMPDNEERTRPWGHGNNPKTALMQFLKENPRFEIDRAVENKLLLTCNPTGYLRCIQD